MTITKFSAMTLTLSLATCLLGQGDSPEVRSWKSVGYLGGAVGVRGTGAAKLTIGPQLVELILHKGPTIQIDTRRIMVISYSNKRMLATDPSDPLYMGPLPNLLPWSHTQEHYIGIEYTLADGRHSGVLLHADKKDYDQILQALRGVVKLVEVPAPK